MREIVVSTRLADREENRVRMAASARGLSRAAYARRALLDAVERDLERALEDVRRGEAPMERRGST